MSTRTSSSHFQNSVIPRAGTQFEIVQATVN